MKEDPDNNGQSKRRASSSKPLVALAAILAVIQACFTVEGMGIEGFILWVLILFVGYWLFFMFVRWVWQKFNNRP
jgi:fatty acid desaturase